MHFSIWDSVLYLDCWDILRHKVYRVHCKYIPVIPRGLGRGKILLTAGCVVDCTETLRCTIYFRNVTIPKNYINDVGNSCMGSQAYKIQLNCTHPFIIMVGGNGV